MAPLIILLTTFFAVYLVNRTLLSGRLNTGLIARIALSMMLLATGISHFTSTDVMVEMMPDVMPLKREMVYFTGICELAAAVGLLFDRTARLAAVMLIIFFLAILPANIIGSLKQIQLGGMENGPLYLLFRIPLQVFFIWWAWYFGVRRIKPA